MQKNPDMLFLVTSYVTMMQPRVPRVSAKHSAKITVLEKLLVSRSKFSINLVLY